jgi:hypothetical protein
MSAIIELEALQKEYDVLLKDYNQQQIDYINALQNKNNPKFTIVPDSTYNGTFIKSNVRSTESECTALCSTDKNCTGATYNVTKSSCSTYSGNGTIVNNVYDDNNVAIISNIKYTIFSLDKTNKRLIELNQQINTLISNKLLTESEIHMKELNKSSKSLNDQYDGLLKDRSNINDKMNDYLSNDNKYKNSTISTTQITNQYIIWYIFAIIVLSITIVLYFIPDINAFEKFPIILIIVLLISYFTYEYFQKINITNPNLDFSYNFNKINYFNY